MGALGCVCFCTGLPVSDGSLGRQNQAGAPPPADESQNVSFEHQMTHGVGHFNHHSVSQASSGGSSRGVPMLPNYNPSHGSLNDLYSASAGGQASSSGVSMQDTMNAYGAQHGDPFGTHGGSSSTQSNAMLAAAVAAVAQLERQPFGLPYMQAPGTLLPPPSGPRGAPSGAGGMRGMGGHMVSSAPSSSGGASSSMSSMGKAKGSAVKYDRDRDIDFQADVNAIRELHPQGPWDKLDVEEVAKRRRAFFEMTREQRDYFMFGMLSVLDGGDTTRSRRLRNAKRKNMHTFYCFDHNTPISRDLFLAIYGVSKKYLDNLRKQMKEKGLKSGDQVKEPASRRNSSTDSSNSASLAGAPGSSGDVDAGNGDGAMLYEAATAAAALEQQQQQQQQQQLGQRK